MGFKACYRDSFTFTLPYLEPISLLSNINFNIIFQSTPSGAGTAQLIYRLAMGLMAEWSKFKSR
jgi:hypothetical protein